MSRERRALLTGAFQDLLWPTACLACGRETSSLVLCAVCSAHSRRTATPPLAEETPNIRTPLAVWTFDHDAPIRTVLHRLKYGNCPWIGRYLGMDLASSGLIDDAAVWDLIVPVPLHPKRFLDRGYNQSGWIARGLGESMKLPVVESELVRTRNTRTQTTMVKNQRAANVAGAFSVRGRQPIQDCSVLLVDDTLTTGATLHAAARTLVAAGAIDVQPVAVAEAILRMDQEQRADGAVITSRNKQFFDDSSFHGYHM